MHMTGYIVKRVAKKLVAMQLVKLNFTIRFNIDMLLSIRGFQFLHILSSRTCNFDVINKLWRHKSCRSVGKKDPFFFQNTVARNVFTVENVFLDRSIK